MRLIRLIAAAAASVLICGAASAQTAANDVPTGEHAPAGQRAGGFWTPAVMAAARPVPKPNVNPDAVRAAGRGRAAFDGQPITTPANIVAAPPGTERKAGNVEQAPLTFAGKLFFSRPDGDYVCSGQFISKRVILTAGHCVRDDETGNYHSDFLFALQYDKGRYSEVYDYDCVATFDGWVQPGDEKWTYDFGMIRVTEDSKNGWFGTRRNWAGLDRATKIGYPGGVLNGQVIQVDAGPISVTDGIVQLKHGNMADQGGSSGGAWISDFKPGSADLNHIISVESFGYDEEPGVDYGPYFDGRLKILWDYVEGGCN